ncbi:uncharacterized protein LOC132752093 [Ruditapes philippinarum]|uniref:uncharacterized protein LOC132752093 n=1 Tax=Ruditapes philippinarum TaxID=129788 RepID=UPI00295B27A9|nr:uncharacterized protein LOC132752093 [Ruditapes philippinarum]
MFTAVVLPILLTIFQVTTVSSLSSDPCDTATDLPMINQRIIGYKLVKDEKPVCDKYLHFLGEWFSLMGKYVIANTTLNCGTNSNWYLKDKLPKNGTKDVEVCLNEGPGKTCSEKTTIQAKKCSKGYVFHLSPTTACSEAYCIQPIDGNVKSGSGPPDISSVNPIVNVEVVKKYKVSLEFYCDILPPKGTDLQYVVEWSLFSGTSLIGSLYKTASVRYFGQTDFRSKTSLKEHHLKSNNINTPGFTLGCTVKARNGSDGMYSHSRNSAARFFGIQVANISSVRLKDSETKTIFLKLTIPFGCPHGECFLDVNTYIPKTRDSCLIHRVSHSVHSEGIFCGVRFYKEDYEKGSLKPFTITATFGKSQVLQSGLVYDVVFVTGTKHDHSFFANYQAASVRVELDINQTKLQGKECYSRSDPHMLTFDGRKYDNQRAGTFIMYKHKELAIEVQTKTKRCSKWDNTNWRPWCNCAVAVRAGKDLFISDYCKDNYIIPARFAICEDGILSRSVKRLQNKHKIFLPSGGIVELENDGQFINVQIKPSLVDFGKTEGLCGSFDDNKANDNAVRTNSKARDSSESWIVNETAGENLFDKHNYQKLEHWKESRYLCSCVRDTSRSYSDPLNPAVMCDPSRKILCPEDRKLDTVKHTCDLYLEKRRKRSTDKILSDHYENAATSYFPTKDFKNDQPYPEVSVLLLKRGRRFVYNNVTARLDCLKMMNTSTFRTCKKIPGLDFNNLIEICIADAMLTNTMNWTLMHLEAIKAKCINHVDVMQPIPEEELADLLPLLDHVTNTTKPDSSLKTTSAVPVHTQPNTSSNSGFLSISLELLSNIKANSCPNECSGHGKCTNGTCFCDIPFTSFDCSINGTKPPVLLGIPDKGKCDLNERKCAETSVIGRNFAETKSLKCRLISFTIDRYNNVEVAETVETSGYFESLFEVYCPLSNGRVKRSKNADLADDFVSRGFRVSVSNDGNGYSDEDSIVIFDSQCVDCSKVNGKIVCTTKTGFCMKGGKCFHPGDKVGCQICKTSSFGYSHWENGPDCLTPVATEDNGTLWIIGAVLGAFAFILLSVIAVMCYLSKRGRTPIQKIKLMAEIK